MTTISYTLRIVIPDVIDPDTLAEIEDGADEQDKTPQAKVGRYLGGYVNDAANQLGSWLPEGFYAKVDDNG